MKRVSKGNANRETLGDRMKKYEAVTTSVNLIERLPIYARIDMRAGHSWCKSLNKPFDEDYAAAMKFATSYITERTGAAIGYCQSDEASFVWKDHTKIPFETRLFKLESVLASMFTGAFMKHCLSTRLAAHALEFIPSFDARVLNLPSLSEAANMIMWRERDSIKNSITLLALEHFTTAEINKKNSADKIAMLKGKGVDYYAEIPEDLRNGAYFRRESVFKELSDEEIKRIPVDKLPPADEAGKRFALRSRVEQVFLGQPLDTCDDKVALLFP